MLNEGGVSSKIVMYGKQPQNFSKHWFIKFHLPSKANDANLLSKMLQTFHLLPAAMQICDNHDLQCHSMTAFSHRSALVN